MKLLRIHAFLRRDYNWDSNLLMLCFEMIRYQRALTCQEVSLYLYFRLSVWIRTKCKLQWHDIHGYLLIVVKSSIASLTFYLLVFAILIALTSLREVSSKQPLKIIAILDFYLQLQGQLSSLITTLHKFNCYDFKIINDSHLFMCTWYLILDLWSLIIAYPIVSQRVPSHFVIYFEGFDWMSNLKRKNRQHLACLAVGLL